MKFAGYVALVARVAVSSALALGLVFAILLLVSGGVEGEISLDIDLSVSDATWFLLGTPALVTVVFLIISPLSFFIHKMLSRTGAGSSGKDA